MWMHITVSLPDRGQTNEKLGKKKNFREDSERLVSSSGKSAPTPSLLLPSSASSLHLTPQCLRIKMTTHFQQHTQTHTKGISLGSVRGCYRPYFITDFTHVSNHKIRVSHFSGQTQTSPLCLSTRQPRAKPIPLGCPTSSHAPFTHCQGPHTTPNTHTLTYKQVCAHTAPTPSKSNKRNCQLSTFNERTKGVLWENHFEKK